MPPALAAGREDEVPDRDECMVCELNCRLVSSRAADRTGEARGLAFPAVAISSEQLAEVFAHYVPVVQISGDGTGGTGEQGQQQRAGGSGEQGQPQQQQQEQQQQQQQQEQHQQSRQGEQSGAEGPASTSGVVANVLRVASNVLSNRLGIVLPWADQLPCGRPSGSFSWSHGRQWLAAAHKWDAVLIYDLDSYPAAANGVTGSPRPVTQVTKTLLHELQRGVACVEWRPTHGSMVAVGCEQGVCLWALGKQPLSGSGFQRQGPAGAAWMSVLKFRSHARVSALAWSPDGRLLAGASCNSNRVMVWEAALGLGSALRLDVAPMGLLSWSPDGHHLFAAGLHGRFFLWETARWTVRAWDTPGSGAVISGSWSSDGRVLLLAMSNSAALVALHLVGSGEATAEQLLPVQLPGVTEHDRVSSGQSCIADMAWDPTCQRLAVALQAPHPAAGCIALYSTSYAPVVMARLLGFARPWCPQQQQGQQGQGQQQEQQQQQQGQQQQQDGQQDGDQGRQEVANSRSEPDPSSMRLTFARHFNKKGALLSVRSVGGDRIANLPLYF